MTLEIENLGFYYDYPNWIFRNVNLSINSGEVVGLQGPSGRGKTTLGRIISGYEIPKEGSVFVDGESLKQSGYAEVQLIHQHAEKTMNPRWEMAKVLNEGWQVPQKTKLKLGIKEDFLTRYPNEISGGERQRFAIARALGPDTKYLVADEISTMLDAITQVEIWQGLLEEVETRNIGVLAISHDEALLKEVTNRVIRFD